MLSFTEFLSETFLQEILDSQFVVYNHEGIRDDINKNLKDKIYPTHTAVLSSEHMDKHKIKVLRFKNKNQEVEYNIMNFTGSLGELPKDKQNQKAFLHALKIINDDSKYYINRGSNIKLQSYNDEQHEVYSKLAKRLIKQYPEKSVKDIGYAPRIDGTGNSRTLMIEERLPNGYFWVDSLNKYVSKL